MWTSLTEHHRDLDPFFRMREDAGPELRRLIDALYRDPDAAIFVWEDEGSGALDGLCIVRIDRAPPIMEESERAEITDLGVRKAERRRGIGSALVAAAFAWVRAAGVERVEIQVAQGNAEGLAFWRALGFEPFVQVLHRRLEPGR